MIRAGPSFTSIAGTPGYFDTDVPLARVTVRSLTRRYRRGRLEALEFTAARVMAHVRSVVAQMPGVSVDLTKPVLLHSWMPMAYLVGYADFWRMVQQTDFGPRDQASLYVFVHRQTLADPWECTLVVSADTSPSLSCKPIVFRGANSPEAQIFARFWHDLAVRCELVLSGLD